MVGQVDSGAPIQVYDKVWLSIDDQLERLKNRGIIISDQAKALEHLQRIGYYRLSAYFYSFRKHYVPRGVICPVSVNPHFTNDYVENTHFSDAVDLYIFDKKLRLLLSDALERIEIALRFDIAYKLGKKDKYAHLDINYFGSNATRINKGDQRTNHAKWLEKYQILHKRSRDDFVVHFNEKYNTDLPIWMAVELLDFGALSQLLAMLKAKDQKLIAQKYMLFDENSKKIVNWVHSFNFLRNIVAHHGRLWNRRFEISDPTPIIWTPSERSHFASNTIGLR